MWRAIEQSLIHYFREQGFALEYDRGDTFVIVVTDSPWETKNDTLRVCLSDLAKTIERVQR